MLSRSYTHRIGWGDCDAVGIVYYPNFYRWFDIGTHELLRLAGFPVLFNRSSGHDTPLVETGCTYLKPGYYDDVIEIASEMAFVKEKVFRVNHRCTHDGVLLCEGFEVRAYANVSTPGSFKAVPMPPEMRAALEGAAS
jgi:YbgC/YbaW family acyl-CoA thioester hydrolase